MRIVTVKMPETYLEAIDELVRMGRYSSRSEVIRTAIRELLRRELWESEASLEKTKRKNAKSKVIEVLREI
ncbi:MAG: ribbon-helix-helix domain-containing protein [Ignisphaera sp.]|jgi:antitoxin ParD1/3/4|nr:ribbon-helix-helix domain-containing protein [Ignisphaera sp.]MCC6055746.1 ribbon-helix-helix domain-containing protein [Desulfurococcaceae archaeon]